MKNSDDAGWSSLVARWAHNPKVDGSNPSPATKALQGVRQFVLTPFLFSKKLIPTIFPTPKGKKGHLSLLIFRLFVTALCYCMGIFLYDGAFHRGARLRHMEMPKEPPHAKAVRPSSIALYGMNYMLYGQ